MKIIAAGIAIFLTGLALGVIVPHPLFALPVIVGICMVLVGGVLHWTRTRRSANKQR